MKFARVLLTSAMLVTPCVALAASMTKGTTFKFAATDTIAAVDCAAKGGSVSTNADANKTCTLPLGSSSLKFANADTLAATDCTTTGGVVSANSDGSKTCTKGATLPATPTPTREPSN